MGLPNPGLALEPGRTALVLTDLQNDFLSPGGNGWALFADSYARNGTVGNLGRLLKAAKAAGLPVLISPHYYYPTDKGWTAPGGATEVLMAQLPVFQRRGPATLDGLARSGADFPQQFNTHVRDGNPAGLSPPKVYGRPANDLVLHLRKRRLGQGRLAGPAGNICVEAHLRDLLGHGFEVAMVRDAIGGTSNEEGDGVQAALVNFRFLAHALWTTDEAVARFADLSR